MDVTQRLIYLRGQVTRRLQVIIDNLKEAKDDPSKVRSSLLLAYEKKLGMYYQEYSNLHKEILDRISSSEFEKHDELEISFDRMHTEALLRIEQLSASLAGKHEVDERERLVLESLQKRQHSGSARRELSGSPPAKPQEVRKYVNSSCTQPSIDAAISESSKAQISGEYRCAEEKDYCHQTESALREHSSTHHVIAPPHAATTAEVDNTATSVKPEIRAHLRCNHRKHRPQPTGKMRSNQPSTVSVGEKESAERKYSKPASMEQPVHTVGFAVEPEFGRREHTLPSSGNLPDSTMINMRSVYNNQEKHIVMSHLRPLCGAAINNLSESAQEELSDLFSVNEHTATSAMVPEFAHGEHFMEPDGDLPDSTTANPRHAKPAQEDPSTLSSHVKTLVNPTAPTRYSESAMCRYWYPRKEYDSPSYARLAPNTAVHVMIFGSSSKLKTIGILYRPKVMSKWHTKPAKPPPMTSANDSRTDRMSDDRRATQPSQGRIHWIILREGELRSFAYRVVQHQPVLNGPRKMEQQPALTSQLRRRQLVCDTSASTGVLPARGQYVRAHGRSGAPLSPTRLSSAAPAASTVNTMTAPPQRAPRTDDDTTMMIDDDSCERARSFSAALSRMNTAPVKV